MSRSGRKPWEEPISYTDDRFPDQPSRTLDDPVGGPITRPDPDLVLNRAETPPRRAPLRAPTGIDAGPRSSGNPRPSWRDGIGNRSTDDTPLNYSRGPHDGELDVDDRDELD